MTLRAQVLQALEKGERTVNEIAGLLGCTRGHVGNVLSAAKVRHLVTCRLVQRGGHAGGMLGYWSLTPFGVKRLPAIVKKRGRARNLPPTEADEKAQIRKRYAVTHAEHVARQRRMGVPEKLIEIAEGFTPQAQSLREDAA